MASMVHIFPSLEQYNLEGYASSAALWSSHFASPSTILPGHGHNPNAAADSVCQPYSSFTEAPPSSSACPHQNDHFSYMDAITRSINADGLSFNPNTSFGMEFPLAEENQLLELMGLQRKLSIHNASYDNDDHDLSQASIAATDDDKEKFSQAYTFGDEAKLSNLARSFSFPLAGGSTESSCAARPPLLLGSDAGVRNPKNFDDKRFYRESSSAATTSCRHISNGDDNELYKGKDAIVKIEAPKDSQCMLGNQEQQGCIEQQETTSNSRAYKQNKKRSTSMNNSNTSAKAARLEAPPDVVHVRARRGQATDSHSLAERVRREKISQRMKVLQEIVPGCHKVLGKAMMLDEIINYVKSLQKQVEFLSMKLAAANQVGMPPIITNEVKFLVPNMNFFGEFSSSCQAMKSEPLTNSLTQ